MKKNKSKLIVMLLTVVITFSNTITNVKAFNVNKKNRITIEIVYCESSIKNKNDFYENYLYTENDDIYILNSNFDATKEWFVLVINDKGNDVFEDNVAIDIYNLDSYIF